MSKEQHFKDELGEEYRYALCYMHYGWDETKFGNDLDELDRFAKEMIKDNSGKPLIIVNGNDEIVIEYAKRLR